MNKPAITELMQTQLLYFDGAMGTMAQQHGLKAGECPELFSLTHPDVIRSIHQNYLLAGATIITANTFGANRRKLAASGYTPDEIITASVRLAKEAADSSKDAPRYVALDIGPIGELLEPMGTLTFEEAYAIFQEEVTAGVKAGADLILIETMADLYEIKAAVLAAKENSSLPIFVTLTVEESGRTYTGCDLEAFAVLMESLGASAIGLNCSLGPIQMLPFLKRLLSLTDLPVIFQPNAGLPRVENGITSYDITPKQFGECQRSAVEAGIRIAGGCCGTTPEYIAQAVKCTAKMSVIPRSVVVKTRLCVPTAALQLGAETKIANDSVPDEELQASFSDYDPSELINRAFDAIEEGAEVFAVNVAADGIEEAQMMTIAVKELQALCRLPFLLVTSNKAALEAGLRCFNGRAAVRIPKEPELIAVAQKYGAVIVE